MIVVATFFEFAGLGLTKVLVANLVLVSSNAFSNWGGSVVVQLVSLNAVLEFWAIVSNAAFVSVKTFWIPVIPIHLGLLKLFSPFNVLL